MDELGLVEADRLVLVHEHVRVRRRHPHDTGLEGRAVHCLLDAELRRPVEDRGQDAGRERHQVDDGENGRVEIGGKAAEDDLKRTDSAGRADDGNDVGRRPLSRRTHPPRR